MKLRHLLLAFITCCFMVGNIAAQKTWKALPTDDTYIKASEQVEPSGSEDIIWLKNSQYGTNRRDGHMRFDLTECDISFPAQSVIVYLFCNPADMVYENPGFFVYKLNGYTNSDWKENELVSANRPTGFKTTKFDSPDFITYWDLMEFIEDAEDRYYAMDITTYANAMKAAGTNELNFIIRGNGSGSGEIKIASKESEDENMRPYVEVTQAGGSGIDNISKDDIQVILNNGSIDLVNVEAGILVEIFSINGVCLNRKKYNSGIDVSNLSGVCILRIHTNGTVINKKITL